MRMRERERSFPRRRRNAPPPFARRLPRPWRRVCRPAARWRMLCCSSARCSRAPWLTTIASILGKNAMLPAVKAFFGNASLASSATGRPCRTRCRRRSRGSGSRSTGRAPSVRSSSKTASDEGARMLTPAKSDGVASGFRNPNGRCIASGISASPSRESPLKPAWSLSPRGPLVARAASADGRDQKRRLQCSERGDTLCHERARRDDRELPRGSDNSVDGTRLDLAIGMEASYRSASTRF